MSLTTGRIETQYFSDVVSTDSGFKFSGLALFCGNGWIGKTIDFLYNYVVHFQQRSPEVPYQGL